MPVRVFVVGMGAVTPAGCGVPALLETLQAGRRRLQPLTLFEANSKGAMPVGEVPGDWCGTVCRGPVSCDGEGEDLPGAPGGGGSIPRTHAMALAAAREALGGGEAPDAVVLGGTTGGMGLSEVLLRAGKEDPGLFRLHGTGTVADYVAQRVGCTGPAITVSTACSSGAVALKLAMEMIRSGRARRVLAGGADCLCRLTYFGFSMLQLIDPEGTRPLDRNRNGMTVAEGAGMLLLEGGLSDCGSPMAEGSSPVGGRGQAGSGGEPFAASDVPACALAELLGAGLSCDAHHPSAPHPEGAGALAAMSSALADAGLAAAQVDYINLHGTGTRDNDAAEARAIAALFGPGGPPLSSTKGAVGHSLAAAGAVEAVVSVLALRHGFLPPNVGLAERDPLFEVDPVRRARAAPVARVLSNSFGFGGNNASVVLGACGEHVVGPGCDKGGARATAAGSVDACGPLRVVASSCITGAGHADETLAALEAGRSVAGVLPEEVVTRELPARSLRRMKRLPRLTLALADAAIKAGGRPVSGVYLGTGWGPLSETWEFLDKLFGSNLEFSSPTDFVGSVHNAVAGQVAIWHKATGPNITATSGDVSFEQALLAAQLTMPCDGSASCLLAADEAHARLSPLFDPSATAGLADGGAGLVVTGGGKGPGIGLTRLARASDPASCAADLVEAAGGPERIATRFGAVFAGIPAARREQGKAILDRFLANSGFSGAVVDYRPILGEFASVCAVACAWAVNEVSNPSSRLASGKGIALLGLGESVSLLEVLP
ncbi:MAG: 3-oxoacyl-ACP synthase [Deltaproteobacteria bacterium]|nr:3-oxoacyl-ACP synthase [Deltaproteobacteria bacterium]